MVLQPETKIEAFFASPKEERLIRFKNHLVSFHIRFKKDSSSNEAILAILSRTLIAFYLKRTNENTLRTVD